MRGAWDTIPSLFAGPTTGQQMMPAQAPRPSAAGSIVPSITVPNAHDGDQVQSVAKLPLINFSGDIVIPAGTDRTINVFDLMGGKCTGMTITQVQGAITLNINGGGAFTIYSTIDIDDAQINSLRIQTGVSNGCILQLRGV